MRRSQIVINDAGHQLTWAFQPGHLYPRRAPQNMRVAYHMGMQKPAVGQPSLAQRYQLGMNIALPADWAMQGYFSPHQGQEFKHGGSAPQQLSKSAVSAAPAVTIPGSASQAQRRRSPPGPSGNVPYLNLFCDPRAYNVQLGCHAQLPTRFDEVQEHLHVKERGIKADGPLFDLPGGQVKMAIGANYTTYSLFVQQTNQSAANPIVNIVQDARNRHVWAGFTQLNVPVFGDQNALPGLRRLDLEFSWRHDQYDDFGGTSNAKVGFNWNPIESFTIRGGWGQSFRAPNFASSHGLQRGLDRREFRSDFREYRPLTRMYNGARTSGARSGPSSTIPGQASERRLLGNFRTRRRQGPSGQGLRDVFQLEGSPIPKSRTGRSASTTADRQFPHRPEHQPPLHRQAQRRLRAFTSRRIACHDPTIGFPM